MGIPSRHCAHYSAAFPSGGRAPDAKTNQQVVRAPALARPPLLCSRFTHSSVERKQSPRCSLSGHLLAVHLQLHLTMFSGRNSQ